MSDLEVHRLTKYWYRAWPFVLFFLWSSACGFPFVVDRQLVEPDRTEM
jgi:hypothetical protein